MAVPSNPLIQECSKCGALLDVSAEEPFALMHCSTCGAAMRVRRTFDHFEIQEELGAGGMGTVYRALDLNLSRPVALKLLQREHSGNPEFVAQFQKEAATTASINHPHVVKVYSTGQDNGLVYIAMELVDKGSLDGLMNKERQVPELQVLSLGIQIAQGLQAALDRGLIHRDIKPGNILFGEAMTAKIVDFGLAVLQEHAEHVAGEVWATPYYVAPETVEGKPEDFRSDMYSLGATLFHALTGRPPHLVETNSMAALAEAKKEPVNLGALAPDVSSATAHALNKVLSHDPAQRQQSYAEFIEHLEFARDGLLGILPEQQKSKSGVAAKPRTYHWLTALTAAITVAAGVTAFHFRDRLLGRTHVVEEPQESPVKKEADEMTYEKARHLLATGDLVKAEAAFGVLAGRTDTPQPQKNWTSLHGALTEFLIGKPDEAVSLLTTIKERGLYSPDPAEEALARFFVESAGQAAGAHVVPLEVVKKLDLANYEALDLLLYGLRDWSLGEYDEAWSLFRQYAQVTPQARYFWAADYKPLVSPYLAEVSSYRAAVAAAKSADSLETRKSALKVVQDSRSQIKLASRCTPQLDQFAQELQQKITAEEEENARRLAEMEAADAKAIAEAKSKIAPLWQQFRPAEAQAVFSAVQVTEEKGKKERESWVKKLTWLARFKAALINDINSVGYAPAVQKRSGTPMPGPIKRANEMQVETATPFGTISAQWTDLQPDSIIAMGKSFLRPDLPPEVLAERQWLVGVYAYFTGKGKESREMLVQASQAVPEHRDELNLFLESAEP